MKRSNNSGNLHVIVSVMAFSAVQVYRNVGVLEYLATCIFLLGLTWILGDLELPTKRNSSER